MSGRAVGNAFQDAVQKAIQRARHRGVLYSVPTRAEVLRDAGVPFLVRVVTASRDVDRGPTAQSASNTTAASTSDALAMAAQAATSHTSEREFRNPFLPYDPDMHVADVPPERVCLLNKFPVVDGHLLIVTRLFQEQTSLLQVDDFAGLWHCLRQYPGLAFYNSGKVAGASQRHRHLQLIPVTPESDIPMDAVVRQAAGRREEASGCFRVAAFPFLHAAIWTAEVTAAHREADVSVGAELHAQYLKLLWHVAEQAGAHRFGDREVSGDATAAADAAEAHPFPYNLLLTPSWMLLVPRRLEACHGINVNGLGFAGYLLAKTTEQLEYLRRNGALHVLSQVAFEAASAAESCAQSR